MNIKASNKQYKQDKKFYMITSVPTDCFHSVPKGATWVQVYSFAHVTDLPLVPVEIS